MSVAVTFGNHKMMAGRKSQQPGTASASVKGSDFRWAQPGWKYKHSL